MDLATAMKKELENQGKSIQWFAKKMGFSLQYIYKLLDPASSKRWNEDSINKACEVLGLEIQIKSR